MYILYTNKHIHQASLSEIGPGFHSIFDKRDQALCFKLTLCFKSKVTWTMKNSQDSIFYKHSVCEGHFYPVAYKCCFIPAYLRSKLNWLRTNWCSRCHIMVYRNGSRIFLQISPHFPPSPSPSKAERFKKKPI